MVFILTPGGRQLREDMFDFLPLVSCRSDQLLPLQHRLSSGGRKSIAEFQIPDTPSREGCVNKTGFF